MFIRVHSYHHFNHKICISLSLLSSSLRRKKEKACHSHPPFFFFLSSFSFIFSKGSLPQYFLLGNLEKWRFLSPLVGVLSPFVGIFFVHFVCFIFLLQVVDILDLEPLTQIWTLGVFFFRLDLVCLVQDLAFLFIGFQICCFFTQIRTLCYSDVVPLVMLGLFQT